MTGDNWVAAITGAIIGAILVLFLAFVPSFRVKPHLEAMCREAGYNQMLIVPGKQKQDVFYCFNPSNGQTARIIVGIPGGREAR